MAEVTFLSSEGVVEEEAKSTIVGPATLQKTMPSQHVLYTVCFER